jgi:hypothetical protein
MLILMAERTYVGAGSYRYSIRTARANGSGRWLAPRSVFTDEAVFKRRVMALLPTVRDVNQVLSKLQRGQVLDSRRREPVRPAGRTVRLEFMTHDEAIDELLIREQEFRQLQDKILSLRMTAPPVDVIVPVVVAIVECQLRIHQLQEFLISPAKKQPWLM